MSVPGDLTQHCCWACIEALRLTPLAKLQLGYVVCPTCGNKRCPKATNHAHYCTGSNDVGQAGSIYGGSHTPQPTRIDQAEKKR